MKLFLLRNWNQPVNHLFLLQEGGRNKQVCLSRSMIIDYTHVKEIHVLSRLLQVSASLTNVLVKSKSVCIASKQLIWCLECIVVQHHHCLCTPPPGTWLEIKNSYLVYLCTYVPHMCTSNIHWVRSVVFKWQPFWYFSLICLICYPAHIDSHRDFISHALMYLFFTYTHKRNNGTVTFVLKLMSIFLKYAKMPNELSSIWTYFYTLVITIRTQMFSRLTFVFHVLLIADTFQVLLHGCTAFIAYIIYGVVRLHGIIFSIIKGSVLDPYVRSDYVSHWP